MIRSLTRFFSNIGAVSRANLDKQVVVEEEIDVEAIADGVIQGMNWRVCQSENPQKLLLRRNLGKLPPVESLGRFGRSGG